MLENNGDLNRELLRLIKLIKESSINSHIARKAKSRLVKTIQESRNFIGINKLRQLNKKHGVCVNLSREDIESLRLLALAETLNCLDQYDSEIAPVMAWLNYRTKSIYLVERNKLYRNKVETVSMDESMIMLVSAVNRENEQERHRLFRELIREDPERILRGEKTRNNITLQQIYLRLSAGNKWKEIADEFKVSISTVSVFFSRKLKDLRIRNYFDKYLS